MGLCDSVLKGQEKDQLDPAVDSLVFLVDSVLSEKGKTTLRVTPVEPVTTPIQSIEFFGSSSVLYGQIVRVRIPRVDESNRYVHPRCLHGSPRLYGVSESAAQIELLSEDNLVEDVRVLRTERSRDYSYY